MRSLLLVVLAIAPASAQPRFEVVSVKPSRPDATARDGRHTMRGDRLEITAATVNDILDMLNGWRLYRVVGGPAWIRTDRFDIIAKADDPIPQPDFEAAVMALLAERFHLQAHKETREIPGYTISAPKSPRGLKPAATSENYSIRMNAGNVVFTASTIDALTNYLSQFWKEPVEDQTNLDGTYDFTLGTSLAVRPREDFSDRLREAVEDLGFHVESKKLPLEMTVVDHCEHPGEN